MFRHFFPDAVYLRRKCLLNWRKRFSQDLENLQKSHEDTEDQHTLQRIDETLHKLSTKAIKNQVFNYYYYFYE